MVTAPMQIALAGEQHLETVLGLIEDARSWLWTKDTDQWENPWPTPSARDERVLAGLRNGKTWIVWDGNIAAGTVTITPRRNTAVWSKTACTCDLAQRAVFIHRLITSRKYAGLDLGAELIAWAGLRGGREYGARWIRIDVWTSNTGLHEYYMGKGFEPCGKCEDQDYPSGALFQKPVAGIRVPASPKFTEASADSQFTEPLDNLEAPAKLELAGR
jgi:Acetyltransferase (GNAT) family